MRDSMTPAEVTLPNTGKVFEVFINSVIKVESCFYLFLIL